MPKRFVARLPLGEPTRQGTQYSVKRDADMREALRGLNELLRPFSITVDAEFVDLGAQLGICVTVP